MTKRRWLVPLAVLAAGVLFVVSRRGSLKQLRSNFQTFSAPSARFYDAFPSKIFSGFYGRIADDVLSGNPSGKVLDVGSGPGRLAVLLAQKAPHLTVTGLDISPEMVERAAQRVEDSGLAGRVRFELGDVEELPFPDERFSAVVSTFSLHHWSYPVGGLKEIYRVVKPGGRVLIYDMPHWFLRMTRHGEGPENLAAATPFRRGTLETVCWPWKVPFFTRLELRKPEPSER